MRIVGVDCSTDPKKTGLALASLKGATLAVLEARVARSREDIVDTVSGWLLKDTDSVLALDAPLGWPSSMGNLLAGHRAGCGIDVAGNMMFQRETDRVVHSELKKKPLEVGANLIARTALDALTTLTELGRKVTLEMGWTPGNVTTRQVIEVYPAATLASRKINSSRYKEKDATNKRAAIFQELSLDVSDTHTAAAVSVDHVLDAVICCVAAADYIQGDVIEPEDATLAQREGWIWVRPAASRVEA